ncbi:MFS transporter [Azospirillum halopraeferens]|uniref:MFS transporter n=1 Tax=Azospirillum halopraeferens TaxID=34010 RepID=UPI00040BDAEF|nr:MFS transporter [Azospirillum halopraeferens]
MTSVSHDPPPAAGAPSRFRSAFRHRAFTLFWGARIAAALALQMQVVAVGWQIYAMTGNPLDLGLVGLFQFLPTLALALVAGHVVDSRDRRRVLLACLLVVTAAVATLALLTAAGRLTPWLIFSVVFVIGAAKSFEGPGYQALLSATVPVEELPNAVAWYSSAHQVATVAGPALGGLLYIAGPTVVYGTSTALLALAALAMHRLRPRRVDLPPRAMSWSTLLAGIGFIRSRPAILGAISLDLFAVLLGGATALLPVFAGDILHVGPWGLGVLRSAPAVGALLMALALARWGVERRAGPKMLVAVAVFGVATIVFGLSRDAVLSFVALAALGAADQVSVFVRQTLIQLSTPDQMRGRVGAVSSLFIGASNQLGEFESGVAAVLLGAVGSVVAGGAGAILIAALWAWRFPALRGIDRLRDLGRAVP